MHDHKAALLGALENLISAMDAKHQEAEETIDRLRAAYVSLRRENEALTSEIEALRAQQPTKDPDDDWHTDDFAGDAEE